MPTRQAPQEHRLVAKVKDYKQVFSSLAGQRVLQDLIVHGHILGTCFSKGDPYESAFMEGERNAVLRILSVLKTSPAEIQARINEMEERRRENA